MLSLYRGGFNSPPTQLAAGHNSLLDTTRRQIPIYRVQPAMGFGYKQLSVLILKSDHSENTRGKTHKLGIDPILYHYLTLT